VAAVWTAAWAECINSAEPSAFSNQLSATNNASPSSDGEALCFVAELSQTGNEREAEFAKRDHPLYGI
jgi:hypothetical protein